MTKAEFTEFVKTVRSYFPRDNFLPTDDERNAWYEMLQDMSFPVAKAALKRHAETSKWAPTVSEILSIVRPQSKSKVRAKDFNLGEISEIDMMLIEKQKAKWGTGAELRAWCEANGLAWG